MKPKFKKYLKNTEIYCQQAELNLEKKARIIGRYLLNTKQLTYFSPD